MRLSNSVKMREADNTAINIVGIPSTELMMTAAGHVADAAQCLMGENASAVIFCGSGNNGGDGVAAALHLIERGVSVRVLLVGRRERMTDDTKEMEKRLAKAGGVVEDFDPDEEGLFSELEDAGVIIDAMFGIGLNSELRGRALEAVKLINASGTPVAAADIASGVEADTGRILGDAVKCDVTVTFSKAKPGHFSQPGCLYCGELLIKDIGLPEELVEKSGTDISAVTAEDVSLPERKRISHKGDYGKLLILGGSVGYTGAPCLCASAAMKSGAGLVFVGVPRDIYAIAAVKTQEAMAFPLECDAEGRFSEKAIEKALEKLESCDNIIIGPGMGRSEALTEFTGELIRSCGGHIIVDADGLFALSQNMGVLSEAGGQVILTPHEGEFLRMGGVLTGDRVGDAVRFAVDHECTLVLKGHRTICAFPDGEAYINTTGNPGMAKGGSGDVLAGIVGALVCQLPLKQAVTAAVWLHGRSGDLCAEVFGEYSMLPGDIIDFLPEAMLEITGRKNI